MDNYSSDPGNVFWDSFPKRELPKRAVTRINVRNLKNLIRKCEDKLSKSERKRAWKVVKDLENGADSYQIKKLPAMVAENSKTTSEYAEFLTDKIATWVKENVVAGPFSTPPTPGFRCNPLIAIARNKKVRPVVNMSGPKGFSFNENLKLDSLEKIKMTTAKEFGFCVKEAGKGAIFSKYDLKDAYKLMPAKPEDYRLQGFKWLNRYFCETQQTFGAIPSVSNFDRLGNTVSALVRISGEIPRNSISRTLDDFQCIGSKNSGIADKFDKSMKSVCGYINIPLADICPKKEKAFVQETEGYVLGIGFNSISGSWFISEEKSDKIKRRCLEAMSADHMDLLQTQKLMGSINDFSQMCKFLKFYRNSGNNLLSQFSNNGNILLPVPAELKKDLLVVCKAAETAKTGLPIADRKCLPPMSTLDFFTDAAGAKYCWQNKKFHLISEKDRGVSCIGGSDINSIWIWSRFSWPEEFLTTKDEKGVEMGRKSTTLESIALLIPFLAFPEKIAGRHVEYHVDNIAVHYGWQKGGIKNDKTASRVLKAVHVLSSFIGCTVHVSHVHRVSCEMSDLADNLTRKIEPENSYYRQCISNGQKVYTDNSFLQLLVQHNDYMFISVLLKEIKERFS